jgi:hypothetical protein
MSVVAFIDLAKIIDDAGFPAGVPQAKAIAIVCAESGRQTNVVYVNSDAFSSRDRGLWQINDHWHPEITDDEAFDPIASTAAALSISKGGTDFSPWSTYENGAYGGHLEAARVALDALSRIKKLQATLDTATSAETADEDTIGMLTAQLNAAGDANAKLEAAIASASHSIESAGSSLAAAQSVLNGTVA